METKKFDEIDQLSDDIYSDFEELHGKSFFADLERKLTGVCSDLDEKYSVSFTLNLDVFDSEREKKVDFLGCGIACFGGKEPYKITAGPASTHRYIVNGEIKKFPHDYCPNCWAEWAFKLESKTCPSCGITLGKGLQLLLDTDVCPYCEKGKVTKANPTCDRCGYVVDPNVIHWG